MLDKVHQFIKKHRRVLVILHILYAFVLAGIIVFLLISLFLGNKVSWFANRAMILNLGFYFLSQTLPWSDRLTEKENALIDDNFNI
jgi:hypothetical protein